MVVLQNLQKIAIPFECDFSSEFSSGVAIVKKTTSIFILQKKINLPSLYLKIIICIMLNLQMESVF